VRRKDRAVNNSAQNAITMEIIVSVAISSPPFFFYSRTGVLRR
jgi:hypothetical protein